MGHADDDFLDADDTGALDQVIEQRNERVAAFEREAFLADVLGMQVALESFGSRELPEDVPALVGGKAVMQAAGLKLVLQPQALVRIGDVRELGADGAAVDALQRREDVPQPEALGNGIGAAAREELGIEIPLAQPEVAEAQHARALPLHQPQGVEPGDEVPAVDPDLDQPRDRSLLGITGLAARSAAATGAWRARWAMPERIAVWEGSLATAGASRSKYSRQWGSTLPGLRRYCS